MKAAQPFSRNPCFFLRGGLRNSLFSRFARIITPPPGGISLPRARHFGFFDVQDVAGNLKRKSIKFKTAIFLSDYKNRSCFAYQFIFNFYLNFKFIPKDKNMIRRNLKINNLFA